MIPKKAPPDILAGAVGVLLFSLLLALARWMGWL